LADIDNIALAVMISGQLTVAVRTVEAAGTSGRDLVSESLLTDFACVLTSAVVQIDVLISRTAMRTVSFKGKIVPVFNRKDMIQCDQILGFDLFRDTGSDDRRCIDSKVGIRDHGIVRRRFLLMGIGMDHLKERFQEVIEIHRSQTCGINEFREFRIVNEICQTFRDILNES
jgi:hypothetical protein